MSDYKAKIEAQQANINLISRYVIDAYTSRTKYAGKRKNFTDKVWEWFDEDTGEVVKTEPLSPKDMQVDFPFAEKPKDDGVVMADAEDLHNGQEPVDGDFSLLLHDTTIFGLLPGGTEPDDDEPDDGTTFDADTYNPDDDKPDSPKRGRGRPRKS